MKCPIVSAVSKKKKKPSFPFDVHCSLVVVCMPRCPESISAPYILNFFTVFVFGECTPFIWFFGKFFLTSNLSAYSSTISAKQSSLRKSSVMTIHYCYYNYNRYFIIIVISNIITHLT